MEIYFDNSATTKISSGAKEKMIELYGENYEANDKECLYKGEINELCVIVRDNVVTSIEIRRTV